MSTIDDDARDRRQPDSPPPGPRLDFGSWTRIVVDVLQRREPDVVATRRGDRVVVLRLGDRTATITQEQGPERVVYFATATGGTTMATIGDPERGDAFTARNIGMSLQSFFQGTRRL